MKYRIKQKVDGYMEGKYYLQKKILWWWFNVEQEQVCIDGLSWMERIWFDSIDEAEQYLNPKKDKVIKEL